MVVFLEQFKYNYKNYKNKIKYIIFTHFNKRNSSNKKNLLSHNTTGKKKLRGNETFTMNKIK